MVNRPSTRPLSTEIHNYIPARPKDDRRSPCPALNTLANHGYLPRSGRRITPSGLATALRDGFGLSLILSYFLAYVGFLVQYRWQMFDPSLPASLDDFCCHHGIEHNASVVHPDVSNGMSYASSHIDRRRWDSFFRGADNGRISLDYIAKTRVARERESGGIDNLHAVIARGEMALILGIFGNASWSFGGDIPVEILKDWWSHERFPDGWQPRRTQGLFLTLWTSIRLRWKMKTREWASADRATRHPLSRTLLNMRSFLSFSASLLVLL